MLNLDTHILIAAILERLRDNEQRVLQADHWGISGIVLWELGQLDRDGRIRIRLDDARVRRVLDAIQILPITFEIAHALRRLDFRSDPADEIIAATSIVHDLQLVTRDARILSSKVVPLALR